MLNIGFNPKKNESKFPLYPPERVVPIRNDLLVMFTRYNAI